jgi:hypothetical protein
MESHNTSDLSSFSGKTAQNRDLERIDYTVFSIVDGNIPLRSRIVLSLFVSLAKLGYSRFGGNIGALLHCLNRIGGQMAERTLYSHLAVLERSGYIRRNKYRVGTDHFRTVIDIDSAALAYWIGGRTGNVVPYPTQSHVSPSMPIVQEDPGTINNSHVNSRNLTNKYKEPRGRARDHKDRKKPTTRTRENPIIYTMRLIAHRRGLHRSDWFRIRDRARWEISAGEDLVAGHSGILWSEWLGRWASMSWAEREAACSAEIIPKLQSTKSMGMLFDGFAVDFECQPDPTGADISGGESTPDFDSAAAVNLGEEAFRLLEAARLESIRRRAAG